MDHSLALLAEHCWSSGVELIIYSHDLITIIAPVVIFPVGCWALHHVIIRQIPPSPSKKRKFPDLLFAPLISYDLSAVMWEFTLYPLRQHTVKKGSKSKHVFFPLTVWEPGPESLHKTAPWRETGAAVVSFSRGETKTKGTGAKRETMVIIFYCDSLLSAESGRIHPGRG